MFYKFSTVNGKSQWIAQVAFFPKSLDEVKCCVFCVHACTCIYMCVFVLFITCSCLFFSLQRCQKHFRKHLNYSHVDLSFEDKTGVIAAAINESSNNWEVAINENHCQVGIDFYN